MTAEVDQRTRLADTVILGSDGYLFHRDHESLEQLTGQLSFNQHELQTWIDVTESRSVWCRENGIVFRMLVVPEKHVVYHDKIPGVSISPQRPAQQLLTGLSPSARNDVLYPLEELTRYRAVAETYFRTDTHWTERGGFVAYEALIGSLPPGFITTPVLAGEIGERPRPMLGDLAVRLDPEPVETAVGLYHTTHRPFALRYHNKGRSRGSTLVYEGDPGGKRVVVFRDSFFNYVIPHLIPAVARLVAVSSIDVHYDLLAAERPDIIIFEIAERLLGNLDGRGCRTLPADRQQAFEALSGIAPEDLLGATAM